MRHDIGFLAGILHWCVEQEMSAVLAQMDLTAAQGRVLSYLNHCGHPPCARDVEEEFQLSHPTVSGILSRMEKKDFIEFRPDEQDRRCKRIFLRPRGRQCHARIHEIIRENEGRIVRDFTEEEQRQFAALLERAVANMGGDPCKSKQKEENWK